MTYITLFKKIINVFKRQTFNKCKINEGLYFVSPQKKANFKTIVLYFPFPEFMHFGDHIFFEPLAKFLKNNNFNLKIYPIKQMEFYFEELNYSLIAKDEEVNEADLIITRFELFKYTKKFNKNTLYFNLADKNIDMPICTFIIQKVADFLKLSINNIDDKPSVLKSQTDVLNKFNIDKNKNYILFNNYVDSAFFRITKHKEKKIMNFAKDFAQKNNMEIIFTGTSNDKNKDAKKYDFINIDLRAKTSPRDLFELAMLDCIKHCVSYDTFIMHLFFLYNKKTFILFRGRFLKQNEISVKKACIPPFKAKNNMVYFI